MRHKKLKIYRLRTVRAIVLLILGVLFLGLGYLDLLDVLSDNTQNICALLGHSILLFPLLELVSWKNRVTYSSKWLSFTLNDWKSHRISLQNISAIEFFNGTLFVHMHNNSVIQINLEDY
ncbi:hypothetical protein EV197_0727 [Aquimarina brevivitae]|uniref:Uncharacterized protein n=1 Tax=Aquimarina brevivitae TaxID=323412 RepID=A0A4Q7PH85_9FLAO|nr:hypothetical protein EV197_0727 [Aquimarina brevivitae]